MYFLWSSWVLHNVRSFENLTKSTKHMRAFIAQVNILISYLVYDAGFRFQPETDGPSIIIFPRSGSTRYKWMEGFFFLPTKRPSFILNFKHNDILIKVFK